MLALFSAFVAHANPGLDWLASQQMPDGSYGQSASSLATPSQSTGEVLRAQLALKQGAAPSFGWALGYLNGRADADTELLARKIAVNAHLGVSAPVPVFSILTQLRAHQHGTGGFGARVGFSPSVFDTAVALEALAIGASPTDPAAAKAVGFLLSRQQANGAWVEGANEPSLYLTALSMRALWAYRSTYGGVSAALTGAQNFLLSRRGADGLWGEDFQSAMALLALVPVVGDLSLVDASAQALRARQQANGSWMDDSFTTALALQALKAHDARKAGSAPAQDGSVSGYVVRANSTEPIEGATITVDQVPGVVVLTNADGYYMLPGLPPASYTVTAHKAGFSSASAVVAAQAGQVTFMPVLVLEQLGQTGLVSGLVFDAATNQPLQAVQVSLSGAVSYSVLSNGAGEFDFGPVAPGSYTLSFEKTGYLTVSGTATVQAGRTLSAQLGLTKAGGHVDDTPGTVSGLVVNAKTGQPLAGALFDLGGGLSATSGADGAIRLASVPRATYQGTLSATGYQPLTFSFMFVPGASGDVGTLLMYPQAPTTTPTSLTLRGLVVDSVIGAPISSAVVTLTETGASVTAGADGRFVLSGITLKNFHLAMSAAGYASATYAMQVAAYGEVDVTLKLSPPGSGATSTQLAGLVTDADSGDPIAGAQVSVAGTSLSITTGTDGRYALAGIASLEFVLNVSSVGYTQQQLGVKLASHGSYTANVALTPVAAEGFQVVSVEAKQPQYGPNATALFTASVASLLSASKAALVLGEVQDGTGTPVAIVRPYAEGTTTPVSEFNFAAGEVKQITLPWNTAQFAPGTYRLVVRVSEPGTISRGAPFGEVLAENSARTSIVPGLSIEGALAINPPMTQAGLPTPVSFSALVRNAGNTPLAAGTYVLTVKSARTGLTLFTAEVGADELPVGNNAQVSFGSWVPSETGNLPVTVQAKAASVPGSIADKLYVGDKATGTFTVSRTVVPEGNQTVHGTIAMQGVDTTVGTGTDPLFALVKESVRRAGNYTATEGVAWHDRNNNGSFCLGCHIETQSLLGLSSAVQKAQIDLKSTQFLFNAINTAQQPDGAIRLSHPEYTGTQTTLGLWSLGEWTDLATSFRVKYRAAQNLYARKVRVGNQTRWDSDHPSGAWWDNSPAITALTVQGYVDVLQSAQKLQPGDVPDYALGAPRVLGAGGNAEGMAAGPDGNLYVVRTSGTITRLNPATGETAVAASGLGSIRGIAITGNGTMYVTRYGGASTLIKIKPDGTRTTLPVSGNIPNATVGPDGWVYLPDWDGNRVVRVGPADQVEVYVSGGLLNRPHGVAFDGAGNLLIANYYAKELLRVAAGTKAVSKFSDGLAYEPTSMVLAADGSVYVTTLSFRGLMRVRPDGIAERVVSTNNALFGLAVAGGKVYVVDQTAAAVREVEVRPQDTSGLAALRDEITPAARYLLANTERDNDNIVHAMRLIGLAEARLVLTDATLLEQLQAKVTSEATLLRARQKADGGWTRYTSYPTTDPLTTAMVGIALEYTNPSPKDPQIRNAIQYLLNKQHADGSWENYNNGLSTRLASTSFVMVFMPKALDRLGGIDIDLYVETPGNIQLANTTVVPTSTPGTGGSVTHVWKLPGVTGDGREVQFDLQLLGMALGEERPAASRAYLEFKNSFVDEKVQLPLDIPVVRTTSGATLAVATDKAAYMADEPVAITATVKNTSQVTQSGQVALAIRASGSTDVLATLPKVPYSGLAAGAQLPLTAGWNVGAALPGDYEVYARLLDAQGRTLTEAVAPFTVQAAAIVAATSVGTDKPIYDGWDVVSLTGRVRNVTNNVALAPTRVELSVVSPTGQTLLAEVRSLTELVPSGVASLPFRLTLNDVPDGTYPVTLVLKDAFTRTVLSTSTTRFQVQRRSIQSLVGTVSVQEPLVHQGEPNACTDQTHVASASGVPGVALMHRLVRMDTGDVLDEAVETVDLPGGGAEHPYTRTISTTGLALGGYACVLQAEVNGQVRTLASAGFRVIEPPIKVTAQLAVAGKGRLLVLVDAGAQEADPFGPEAAPELPAQREFLEQLLTAASWSYTIVESADDFERELRTGGYVAYALFSEKAKLSTQGQKELREAVFRGEGLLVAGAHDSRNHGQYETLGVKFVGHLSQVDSVRLDSAGFSLLSGTFDLLTQEHPERITLAGAESLGSYGAGGPDAVTLHTYGHGESAFMGSDLLAIATRDGHSGTAADLLRILLERTHPESLSSQPGAVVPVLLTVTNQGIAVPVSAQVALPAGTSVVDHGAGTISSGSIGFTFPLEVDAVKTVLFWVRLPSTAGPVTFSATVTAGSGSQTKTVSAELNVSVAEVAALDESEDQLDALISSGHPDAKTLRRASAFVSKALASTSRADAIREVLQAADVLVGLTDPAVVNARAQLGTWLRWASLQRP
jgi:hypothetical protein